MKESPLEVLDLDLHQYSDVYFQSLFTTVFLVKFVIAHKGSCGKVMFLQVSVRQSFHRDR